MKKYFPIIIFIMGFTGFLCGQVAFDLLDQARKEKMVHPKVASRYEKLFSEVTLETTKGEKINFKQVSAPIVIVNFWASWCTPCLEEFPSLVDLRSKFKESEIFILGINSDEENPLREINKVAQKYNFNFPTVADPTGDILSKFDVDSIPLTVIFHKGKVLEVIKGPKDFSSVEAQNNLKRLIEKDKTVARAD